MSRLSQKLKDSQIAVFSGTNNLEDHLGYQFANMLSNSVALFPGIQKYAPELQRIYEEQRETPKFQDWYQKVDGLQPRGMMWTQMLQQTINVAKQQLSMSAADQNTLDMYYKAFTTAINTPGNTIVHKMCVDAAKHSAEPGFILLAQEQDKYVPCDWQKFTEVVGANMEEFRKACTTASLFHRYVAQQLDDVCLSADTSIEITNIVQAFDQDFILQIAHAKEQGMPYPVETAAARITMELVANADYFVHEDLVYELQGFIPKLMDENQIFFHEISWEAGGNDSYEAMLNVNSSEFQQFLKTTGQDAALLHYTQELAQIQEQMLGQLPVTKLSEQILTRVHGLADAWLEDKTKWNAFHHQYQDRFHQSTAAGFDAIERAAVYAAGELASDKGWQTYLQNAGLSSTAHLFEYLVNEITATQMLHGGVYTQPGSEEETYLNAYSSTLSAMPLEQRADFAQRLVEQCEQGAALLTAGHNAFEAWENALGESAPEHIAKAFEQNTDEIERDYLEESI